VSALVAARVYPHRTRFKPTYPHITYEVTSDETQYAFSGNIGFKEANIVYQCVAETYREARLIADAVETSLGGFRGDLTAHYCHGLIVEGVRDSKIQKTDDADSFYYAVNVLIAVSYE
jgi:hypothetical protein